jgi:adenine-specific DNA methylase
MQGTYRAEEAPLPAFHPSCLCRTETILKIAGTQGRVDTLERNLQLYRSENGGKAPIKTIETHNKVVDI